MVPITEPPARLFQRFTVYGFTGLQAAEESAVDLDKSGFALSTVNCVGFSDLPPNSGNRPHPLLNLAFDKRAAKHIYKSSWHPPMGGT